MARKSFVLMVAGMVIFFLCPLSSADVPHMINYQGKLASAAGGCVNDTVQMTFTIYADSQGVSDKWSETQTQVVVNEGIFSVLLGSVDSIPASVFDGSAKYLGVKVESDPEMRPLKPMVSVPYAYRAGTADGGGANCGWVDDGTVVRLETDTDSVGIGTADPAEKLDVVGNIVLSGKATIGPGHTNTGAHSFVAGISNQTIGDTSTVGGGYYNIALGRQSTISGGVQNIALGWLCTVGGGRVNEAIDSWCTVGGGEANSAEGIYSTIAGGYLCQTDGAGSFVGGGYRNIAGGSHSTICGGREHEVQGDYSAVLGGYGDTITTTADYSYLFGIKSRLTEDSTFMVDMPHVRFGDETDGYEFPTSDGSSGQVMITDGSGQLSWADPGECPDCDNRFVNVQGPDSVVSSSDTAFAGKAVGSSGMAIVGIKGLGTNYSTGDAYGGYFITYSFGTGEHYGIRSEGHGFSSSATYGSYGNASNPSTGNVYGGYFVAQVAGTGQHYGVYGLEPAGGGGAAVYAAGDMVASGAKPAVVRTSQGEVLLYAIESPEVWFEDFGEGQLVNGKAHIDLDPLFLETVAIDTSNLLKVFIQLTDPDCKGTAVIRGTTGFDVVELQNGTSNASFSYRIIAKRKGYENERMRQTDVGKGDPNLYPELWGQIQKKHKENQADKTQKQVNKEW